MEKRPPPSAARPLPSAAKAKPLTPTELEEKLFQLLCVEVPQVLATSIMRRAKGSAMGSGDPSRLLEEARAEAQAVVTDLLSAKWPLAAGQYEHYLERAASLAGVTAPSEGLVAARAVNNLCF